MATVLSKTRKTDKQPPATRMCLRCHCVRKVSEFYSNRDWVEQAGRDIWCKKCISQIQTKDEMREYFFENHRKWDERIWENAEKKAQMQAAKNTVFQKSNNDRRAVILEALTCQQVPALMQIHYTYIDNSQDINANTYNQAKEAGKIVEMGEARKTNPNIKTYDSFFNGDFKPAEIEYLRGYYEDLAKDFNLSDVSLRDNAKKLAKAALTADKIQNDYLAGKCSIQDLNNAIAQYDLLMKTGNFAACKRKPGDKDGASSFSDISLYLETHKFLANDSLVVWEKDDVDRTLDEFKYFVEALDIE